MGEKDTAEFISKLAQLRVIIACLGERCSASWWNTSFFSTSANAFLAYNFPRTSQSAAVTSVQEAAQKLHDQSVGQSEQYHLFRLPTVMEEQVHHELSKSDENVDLGTDFETPMALLKAMAGEVEASPGAINCGLLKPVDSATLTVVASTYAAAFQSDIRSFPYFTVQA